MAPIPQTAEERCQQLGLQFLAHSFLYYRLGESVIDDQVFDALAEDLRALAQSHPGALPYPKLLLPALGPEASGYQIKDYPPQVVTAAFKLLYHRYLQAGGEMDFQEFVERRGYRAESVDLRLA